MSKTKKKDRISDKIKTCKKQRVKHKFKFNGPIYDVDALAEELEDLRSSVEASMNKLYTSILKDDLYPW